MDRGFLALGLILMIIGATVSIIPGRAPCPLCNGKGKVACIVCGGTGKRDCLFCDEGKADCLYCTNGKCSVCNGKGCLFCDSTGNCTYCNGLGYNNCMKCSGDGTVSCSLCGAKGSSPCLGCNEVGSISIWYAYWYWGGVLLTVGVITVALSLFILGRPKSVEVTLKREE